MRGSTIVMIAVAVVFGVLSVFMAQSWLNRQADARMKSLQAQTKTVSTRTIVVAKSPLRFGNPLTSQVLREVQWPGEAIPENAFATIAELIKGEKRVVLASMEANEPIVSTKITGPGQKATLSALIEEGMKAVTVRVNDVDGVAGFILPGDRVDVLMTRNADNNGTTDVVLQNIKVLGIDQLADARAEKPTVAKAVTLEVDTVSAQKLALASSAGNLSLMLRRAGDVAEEASRRISITDIGTRGASQPAATRGSFTTIRVMRADKNSEYSVPVEVLGGAQANAAERGDARP
ncbi:MAG TPA: Flp pilus assembly protein CpaB [Xanthobacteraceae bacterium]|nr:Flp pilus assembly protein CpaB [Xanthobacteraceae bacterium]